MAKKSAVVANEVNAMPQGVESAANKNQLGLELWMLHPDATAKEIVELATQYRPDLNFNLGNANGAKVAWKTKMGILPATRAPRTAPNPKPAQSPPQPSDSFSEAIQLIESSGSVDNAIQILEQLKNLKNKL